MGLPGGHCLGRPQWQSGECSPPWAPVPTLPAQLRRGGGGASHGPEGPPARAPHPAPAPPIPEAETLGSP